MKNVKSTTFSLAIFFVFLVVGTLTSCKSGSVPQTTKIEEKTELRETVKVKDTFAETKPDSSSVRAELQIIDGKVEIKSVSAVKQGNYLKTPKVTIRDNILTCDCEAEAQKLFFQYKEKLIESLKSILVTPPPVIVEADLDWWQETQIWCGRLFLGFVLAAVIYFILKLFKIF